MKFTLQSKSFLKSKFLFFKEKEDCSIQLGTCVLLVEIAVFFLVRSRDLMSSNLEFDSFGSGLPNLMPFLQKKRAKENTVQSQKHETNWEKHFQLMSQTNG